MENIVFDRNYELASEDNGYADAIYEKAMEPDGFFASFGKKMDAIPKIIVPEDKQITNICWNAVINLLRSITDGFMQLWTTSISILRSICILG